MSPTPPWVLSAQPAVGTSKGAEPQAGGSSQPRAGGELMRGTGEGEVLEHHSHIPPVRLTHPAGPGLPALTTARERGEQRGKQGRVGPISPFWYLGHLIHTGGLLWHWAVRRQVSWTLQQLLSPITSAAEPMPSLRDESLEVSSLGFEFKSDSRNFHCAKN